MLYKNTIEPSTLELLRNLQKDILLQKFHLAGGTSLALQIGHRKSIDLDLFTNEDFDTNYILEYLEQNYNFKLDYISINTLKGSIQEIKVDFISHKYKLVSEITELEDVRLFSVQDIAAMKLNAITGNGTRVKDFIDIYFLLKIHSLNELVKFYNIKYNSRNQLHVIKSLNYFEDITLQDWPVLLKEKKLTFKKLTQNIQKHINKFSEQLF